MSRTSTAFQLARAGRDAHTLKRNDHGGFRLLVVIVG